MKSINSFLLTCFRETSLRSRRRVGFVIGVCLPGVSLNPIKMSVVFIGNSRLDSLVVECWLRTPEFPDSSHNQYRDIPKTIQKWYQQFSCFAINIKMETLALSQSNNTIFECLWKIDLKVIYGPSLNIVNTNEQTVCVLCQ